MAQYIPRFLSPTALALPGHWSKPLKAVAAARIHLIFVLEVVQLILSQSSYDTEVIRLLHYARSS